MKGRNVTLKQKTAIRMALDGIGEIHARSTIRTRDLESIIDEPVAHNGTNLGLTQSETLMASLIDCTNVITRRIGHSMDIETGEMKISLT